MDVPFLVPRAVVDSICSRTIFFRLCEFSFFSWTTMVVRRGGFAAEKGGWAALGDRRCGCGVSRGGGCVPGVLLLGFGSRSAAASREYDAEARRRPSACVNLFPDAAAAAAAVYSRDVLPLALAWLEAQPAAPPDRLHAQLAAEGFAVRGVRPPIAVGGSPGPAAGGADAAAALEALYGHARGGAADFAA